jgi:PAS domain S-box-containing protein
MAWLDMRTVIFSQLLTDFICVMVILFLWAQNRRRYPGLTFWLACFILQAAAMILIVLRGSVPDWASMTVSNTFVAGGLALLLRGLDRFFGSPRARLANGALIAAFAAVHFYFTQFKPTLEIRTMVLSVALLILAVQVMALTWSRARAGLRSAAARIGFIFAAFALISLIRVISLLAGPSIGENFFQSGPLETGFLLLYQLFFILTSFGLILLVNERLIGDVKAQEEKFGKAFRSAPYALTITDPADGRMLEVNDGFVGISGYSYKEAVGQTTESLRLWENENDRHRAVEALADGGRPRNMEFGFRRKSGELMVGLWSAELVTIDGRPRILSSISDITLRKLSEKALAQSLEEKDLLMRELRHRVKNSLAVVSSLVGLSSASASKPIVGASRTDLRARIRSISSVYEQLDRTGRVDVIHLREYILSLVESLTKSYGPPDGPIRVSTRLDDLVLDSGRALPLGLIINELIINAFKYAYPAGSAGEIRVELHADGAESRLTVADDGSGRADEPDPALSSGTGLKLVELLAAQIDARISRPSGPGTTVVISF